MVKVKNLIKIYKRHKSKPGLKNILINLFKREYEEVKALDGISFDINSGEIVGYIGPNGAGKTTTLKILSGILYPTSGEISVNGYIPYKRNKEFLKNISFVMAQKMQLWWDLPAFDSFKLNQKIYEIPQNEFNMRINLLAEMFRVKELLYIPLRRLSLGERMKMELISALIHLPKVLFLDEPTIGLDLVSQEDIRNFLKNYRETVKATILVTSHNMRDIESICDRIIIIHKGKLLEDASAEEIIKKFSIYKVITMNFSSKVPQNVVNFGKIISKNENKIKIKVKIDELDAIKNYIIKKYQLNEFTISEPSLEDTILDIFKGLV